MNLGLNRVIVHLSPPHGVTVNDASVKVNGLVTSGAGSGVSFWVDTDHGTGLYLIAELPSADQYGFDVGDITVSWSVTGKAPAPKAAPTEMETAGKDADAVGVPEKRITAAIAKLTPKQLQVMHALVLAVKPPSGLGQGKQGMLTRVSALPARPTTGPTLTTSNNTQHVANSSVGWSRCWSQRTGSTRTATFTSPTGRMQTA